MKTAFLSLLILFGSTVGWSQTDVPKIDRVVLVSIDTLRQDHLPFYGYPRQTAPFLSKVAERSVVYDNCYSPSSHTNPSHATMLTGLYPFEHGSLINGVSPFGDVETLGEILNEKGFQTVAFTGVRFLKSLGRGFNQFDVKQKEEFYGFRLGEEVVGQATRWVDKLPKDEKFFAWVHLYDVHEWNRHIKEYDGFIKKVKKASPPKQKMRSYYFANRQINKSLLKKEKVDLFKMMDGYDGRIQYVDNQIERLYWAIENKFLDGHTLWIITADHGEGLGQHSELGHGKHLYNEQLRVPLLVHISGHNFHARRIKSLVRLVDLKPTITDLVGVDSIRLSSVIRGQSLVPTFFPGQGKYKARFSFAQRRPVNDYRLKLGWKNTKMYVLQDNQYKYIYRTKGKDQFFDLEKDPKEKVNLIRSNIEEKDAFKNRLLSLIRRRRTPEKREIPEGYLQSLRSLGYMQ